MPHVIEKLSDVKIAICPLVSSLAIFFVIFEESLILIADLIDPLSFSVPHSVDEITFVRSPVLPNIVPVTIGFPMQVIALIDIPICESLYSITMLLECVELA
jgi:hypothetical protein